MSSWQRYLEEHRARFTEELLEFLRIPSISSLPEHAKDVEAAAAWVAGRLERAGLEAVRVLPTGGHPVVYGEHLHAPGKPTVLIYGHFDVQPADPLALWDSPPFEPVIQGERVYARGASDDKGNMLAPILALEALLGAEGALPVNVKVLFEGQEEIGSPQLPAFVAEHKALLACDLVLSADGSQWEEEQPGLWLGLKGICALQIDVTGAKSDLHSGGYGGAVANPLHALVHLLDTMHDADGRVSVEGFYDRVKPITAQERAQIAAVPFDEAAYKARLGVDALYGEAGYSTLERNWLRPTLELNGLWGGFSGEGVKTVLPREAHAKLTCRLVPEQDPDEIVRLIERHVAKHTLPGVKARVWTPERGSKAYAMPADHPGNAAAKTVLETLYGTSPYYVRAGGSIPFCSIMLELLGVYTVNFGFGLRDEQVHAPNEFFRLASFERSQRGYAMLLTHLGSLTPAALAVG